MEIFLLFSYVNCEEIFKIEEKEGKCVFSDLNG